MKRTALALVVALAGCQTTLDPNYAIQLESYRLTITSQQNVEMAKARAEEARYNAIATVAERADPASKQMAIFALALLRGGEATARAVDVVLPRIPETQKDRALKWASVFAGPVTAIATGYFGYRLGQTQSNNQAATTQSSYAALVAFKPQPIDWSKLPPTSVVNTTTNTRTDFNNEVSEPRRLRAGRWSGSGDGLAGQQHATDRHRAAGIQHAGRRRSTGRSDRSCRSYWSVTCPDGPPRGYASPGIFLRAMRRAARVCHDSPLTRPCHGLLPLTRGAGSGSGVGCGVAGAGGSGGIKPQWSRAMWRTRSSCVSICLRQTRQRIHAPAIRMAATKMAMAMMATTTIAPTCAGSMRSGASRKSSGCNPDVRRVV